MKKGVFIGIGLFIIILIGAVWVYLILYGAPEDTGDIFTDLGLNNPPITGTTSVIKPEPITPGPDDLRPEQLRQLTVRPVVGAVLFSRDGETLIRYIESGVGHVYEINPRSGKEILVSETTFVRITRAVFSFDGNLVALVAENPGGKTVFVGAITNAKTLVGEYLPPGSDNVVFSEAADAVRFTVSGKNGTRGYREDLVTKTRSLLFNIPLMSVHAAWEQDDDHLITTKPSKHLAGFMYEIEKNSLKRLLGNVFGLTTLVSDEWVAYGGQNNGSLIGGALNRNTGSVESLPLYILPEKCDFSPHDKNDLWCAWPIVNPDPLKFIYPDDWYQGTHSSEDVLWQIDLREQTATLQSNFKSVSGRNIDVSGLIRFGDYVLFTNKLDNTLWLFNTSS